MSDEPDPTPKSGKRQMPVSIIGSAQAPILYFDDAPTFGYLNGVVQVTLDAMQLYPDPPGVKRELVVVAHLRMNVRAAQALRAALDGALLLSAPTESDAQN